MTVNQRNECLYTTVPAADLSLAPTSSPVFFPHIADGDGYMSSFILLNIDSLPQSGVFRFFADDGSPLTVHQTGGTADTSFRYAIPGGGIYLFQTDGSSPALQAGSVQLVPDPYSTAPVGCLLYTSDAADE